ncbi:MAG: DUF1295 domain-containing protein [Gammaproteobacteria bacterium]
MQAFAASLAVILMVATCTWLYSAVRGNVTIVDSAWSLFFLLGTSVYLYVADTAGPRSTLILVLVAAWALRLSVYLTWRNSGKPEDHRYGEIRRRNSPGFTLKSLYLVFGLQGILAWIIALPLYAAVTGSNPIGFLDYLGVAVWTIGFVFESVGDYQLAQFKSDPRNEGRVMNSGLWRYTRHPNYFGDFCIWWGFYLIALSAGGWWTLVSAALMSWLLLRVSGVVLLEKDIAERRPGYARYIEMTNAFFPWFPVEELGCEESRV